MNNPKAADANHTEDTTLGVRQAARFSQHAVYTKNREQEGECQGTKKQSLIQQAVGRSQSSRWDGAIGLLAKVGKTKSVALPCHLRWDHPVPAAFQGLEGKIRPIYFFPSGQVYGASEQPAMQLVSTRAGQL